MRLPDFLIIGAMKSGTSSLHRYLGQHPDITMTRLKELNFFSQRYEHGIEWYMEHFSSRLAGESSPNYLKAHRWPHTAARIHAHLPRARLICVLRNPVDRALSHYLHAVRYGKELRPFSEAVEKNKNLSTTSRYAWQLEHYLQFFDPRQIMLFTTEEMDYDPAGTVGAVFRFLDVNEQVTFDASTRYNVTADKLKQAGAVVPHDPHLLADDFGNLRVSETLRARLADFFRDDVEKLTRWWPGFPGWKL